MAVQLERDLKTEVALSLTLPNYSTITLDGVGISVVDLKKLMMIEQKRLANPTELDLGITKAQSKEGHEGIECDLVHPVLDNSVLIVRIPICSNKESSDCNKEPKTKILEPAQILVMEPTVANSADNAGKPTTKKLLIVYDRDSLMKLKPIGINKDVMQRMSHIPPEILKVRDNGTGNAISHTRGHHTGRCQNGGGGNYCGNCRNPPPHGRMGGNNGAFHKHTCRKGSSSSEGQSARAPLVGRLSQIPPSSTALHAIMTPTVMPANPALQQPLLTHANPILQQPLLPDPIMPLQEQTDRSPQKPRKILNIVDPTTGEAIINANGQAPVQSVSAQLTAKPVGVPFEGYRSQGPFDDFLQRTLLNKDKVLIPGHQASRSDGEQKNKAKSDFYQRITASADETMKLFHLAAKAEEQGESIRLPLPQPLLPYPSGLLALAPQVQNGRVSNIVGSMESLRFSNTMIPNGAGGNLPKFIYPGPPIAQVPSAIGSGSRSDMVPRTVTLSPRVVPPPVSRYSNGDGLSSTLITNGAVQTRSPPPRSPRVKFIHEEVDDDNLFWDF